MNLQNYEVHLSVDGEVTDRRLAESAEQAGEFARDDVEEGIAKGLRQQLSGGSSSFDVDVTVVREAGANGGDDDR